DHAHPARRADAGRLAPAVRHRGAQGEGRAFRLGRQRAEPGPPRGRSARHSLNAMTEPTAFPIEGGCDCRAIRYRMETAPLVVHCCHCRWCQRESGASFALNAMIESDRVTNLGEAPELVLTPSESGRGQSIARCPHCRVAVWSHYAGAGPAVAFVRVGTLDEP